MPLKKAMQLAPDGNFIRGTRGLYSYYSKKVRNIFYEFTPLVEPMSIDEAYLDVTDVLMPYSKDVFELAKSLKEKVKINLNITCSIGISSNKVCSKIASKQNKPDGITYVKFGEEKDFLSGLPVERIPGVGKATLKLLNKYGIFKIGDISKFESSFYLNELGMQSSYLLKVANGIDEREIVTFEDYEQKSLSKETTLNYDTDDKIFLEKELYFLLEKACSRLRKKNFMSRNLTVKVKYADFTVNQKSLINEKYSNLEMDFYDNSVKLLNLLVKKGKSIRLLGVRFADLSDCSDSVQEDIFNSENKYTKLIKNVDKLRDKFNFNIIKFGKTFDI
jgi:DNA polymerase-4